MKNMSTELNQPANLLGLTAADIIFVCIIFLLSQMVLVNSGKEYLALIIGGTTALLFIPVRLKFRKRIIRDTIASIVILIGRGY